jgi:integrase
LRVAHNPRGQHGRADYQAGELVHGARVPRPGRGGKRRYHNKTVRGRKKDAQAYLNKTLRQIDTGEFNEPSREPLNTYLDRWLETAARPRVRSRTFADYQGDLARYVRPEIGTIPLGQLTPLQIQAVYSKMMAPKPDGLGLSARTVRKVHAPLRSALKQAVKWRLIPTNPAEAVDLPKQNDNGDGADREDAMRALSKEEANRFLEAARSDRWYPYWLLLLTSGLRPGEALGLKWSDLEEPNDTQTAYRVRVRRTVVRIRGKEWTFGKPKTKLGARAVALPSITVEALKEHRKRQAAEKLAAEPDTYTDHDLIFATSSGAPLAQTDLRRRHFLPILERAGLPKIRVYDLRHTAATLLLAAGEHPKVVSERLGHATITLTLDTYSHVLPDMQEPAAEKLEAMFG